MPVPGLSLLGLKRIRGFVSILRYINLTIIIIIYYKIPVESDMQDQRSNTGHTMKLHTYNP